MRLFECPNCKNALYFENYSCVKCESVVGFDLGSNQFKIIRNEYASFFCSNRESLGCNWITTMENTQCSSCYLTNYHPQFPDTDNYFKYKLLETAKRRLMYQLYQLKLPRVSKKQNIENGLQFDFLTKDNAMGVMTGYAKGTITILLTEADSVHREQLRKQMSEPYRTLLGHYRHETGHYYWNFLINNQNLFEFRQIFGNEQADYGEALKAYYAKQNTNDWQNNYISKYASAHPSEDWAETWAHYLHLMDTLETAFYLGISLHPIVGIQQSSNSYAYINPYEEQDFRILYDHGIALTNGVNSLNRSMGIPDIYPFVIPKPVHTKLDFIHKQVLSFHQNIQKFTI